MVIPGARYVRRQKKFRPVVGSPIRKRHRGDQRDAAHIDLVPFLDDAGKLRGAGRPVAFTKQELRRSPTFVARDVLVDEIREPVRVFDDGKKTYIQISQAARNREAPVLVVIGADGKQEMVNYRVKDDMYIVDRLFEKAELILGSGKKARKVEIDRERKS